MKIKIDGQEIHVTDPEKNIVEIGDDNMITMLAPCVRNKRKHGCCKACVIEANGKQTYACATQPEEGMDIIYDRSDLAAIRQERLNQYMKNTKTSQSSDTPCCGHKKISFDDQSGKDDCACGCN